MKKYINYFFIAIGIALIIFVILFIYTNNKLNRYESILETRKEMDIQYKEHIKTLISGLISGYEDIITANKHISSQYEELYKKLTNDTTDFENSLNRYDNVWQIIRKLRE